MAGAGRKWAIGCGIGCGLVLLAAGGVGSCGYVAFKKVQGHIEEVEATSDELEAVFGKPEAYVPPADGAIPPDRMELFLAVREDLTERRVEMSRLLTTLEEDGGGGFIAKFKAGTSFIPAMMDFVAERNRILLDRGMGLGEYEHLYVLSYLVHLEKDPGDGPGFVINSDDEEDDEGFTFRKSMSSDDEQRVRRDRGRQVREQINRTQRRMLENQLVAAESAFGVDSEWVEALRAEVVALDDEYLRLPWEEGLPDGLRASIAPYQDRLEAAYEPMTSILEVGFFQN